jgi:hypothetical protein
MVLEAAGGAVIGASLLVQLNQMLVRGGCGICRSNRR